MFSSYWCLKFKQILESQKLNFSNIPIPKELNKMKFDKNHSKPTNLVPQSLFQ